MTKTCLKVFKVNCSKLRKSLSLEAFACLEDRLLGHDGSVLLSIITQTLLCNFLVCMFLLLSFPTMPMTAISGKSRLLSPEFYTGARCRRRVAEGGLYL
jgi:hypothetical protein